MNREEDVEHMNEDPRWSEAGLPVLTGAEQAGMKDFWEAYEAHYDDLNEELLAAVKKLPDLAAVLERMSREQMEAQAKRSRELMRAALVDGRWGPLLDDQRSQGAAYANMGVRFREWFDLVGDFQTYLVPHIVRRHQGQPERLSAALLAMSRYVDIAMSTIAEEYLQTKEKRIAQQQEAIHELSTPVLQVQERLLLMPIIGVIDTQRARLLTEQLLRSIRANRAKVVVMDITGVPAVDSKVANHLLQTVAAARLMGSTVVVTGLSAEVAQALVTLGVDLSALNTVGDLQGGLEEANRILGYHFTPDQEEAAGAA